MSTLGMVTPIIATIKNIMDKEKLSNASKYISSSNPIQYQTSEEENIDTAGTDDTLDDQYLGESTKNFDKNRKF